MESEEGDIRWTFPGNWKGGIFFCTPKKNGASFNFDDFITQLCKSSKFRQQFFEFLASQARSQQGDDVVPYRFETPPVTLSTCPHREFEFVLVKSPSLAREADSDAFSEHLDQQRGHPVVSFPSLGRDCRLIVPQRPVYAFPPGSGVNVPDPSHYVHLASFTVAAPPEAQQALWQLVGQEFRQKLSSYSGKVWLSTAGGGVPWLHVRLDERPKYYHFRQYANE